MGRSGTMERNLLVEICSFKWMLLNHPYKRDHGPSRENPTAIQYSSFVLSIITLVLGLVGNVIVIIITGFVMKTQKSRIWFLNLAIADLMFLLLLPLNAVSVLGANWSYGEHVCKMYNFLSIVNMYASIFLITALTCDRFLAVLAPIWHHKFHSPRVCYWTCASIWLVTVLASIPVIVHSHVFALQGKAACSLYDFDMNALNIPIEYKVTVLDGKTEETNVNELGRMLCQICSIDKYKRKENMCKSISTSTNSYLVTVLVIGYFIPLCVIFCSNVAIAFKVRTSGTNRSSKLYGIVTAAVMAFFLTRTPLVIGQIIFSSSLPNMDYKGMSKITIVYPLLSSIANLNCCLNPIIYVFVGREVMSVFTDCLRRIRHRNVTPSCPVPATSTQSGSSHIIVQLNVT